MWIQDQGHVQQQDPDAYRLEQNQGQQDQGQQDQGQQDQVQQDQAQQDWAQQDQARQDQVQQDQAQQDQARQDQVQQDQGQQDQVQQDQAQQDQAQPHEIQAFYNYAGRNDDGGLGLQDYNGLTPQSFDRAQLYRRLKETKFEDLDVAASARQLLRVREELLRGGMP